MDNTKELEKKIKKLEDDVRILKGRRILQSDVLPDVIKVRHMGEGNRYFYAGVVADLPDGASVPNSVTCYFATDTDTLYIYNGTTWVSVGLT